MIRRDRGSHPSRSQCHSLIDWKTTTNRYSGEPAGLLSRTITFIRQGLADDGVLKLEPDPSQCLKHDLLSRCQFDAVVTLVLNPLLEGFSPVATNLPARHDLSRGGTTSGCGVRSASSGTLSRSIESLKAGCLRLWREGCDVCRTMTRRRLNRIQNL